MDYLTRLKNLQTHQKATDKTDKRSDSRNAGGSDDSKAPLPEIPQIVPASHTPEAGYTYCPNCGADDLERLDDHFACPACKSWWIPSIDLDADSPAATVQVQHPDGHTLTIAIYRCPECRETRWGPRLDDPKMWYCLTCATKPEGPQKQSQGNVGPAA